MKTRIPPRDEPIDYQAPEDRIQLIEERLLIRYQEAADTVLLDGSTPWEIDEAMVEFGCSLGPFARQDRVGLDVAHAKKCAQKSARDPARRYIPIADRMIELGKLGCKTGAGWYRYPGGAGRVDDPIVADLGIEEAYFAGIERKDYSADEIRERLLLAIINESAEMLYDATARSVNEVNLAAEHACGFPRSRVGLWHYADSLGARHIVERLTCLCEEDPVAWKVSELLSHCAGATISIFVHINDD